MNALIIKVVEYRDSYGNTYQSARLYEIRNGEQGPEAVEIARLRLEYGYGEYYMQRLREAGVDCENVVYVDRRHDKRAAALSHGLGGI